MKPNDIKKLKRKQQHLATPQHHPRSEQGNLVPHHAASHKKRRKWPLLLALGLLAAGGYLLVLVFSPSIKIVPGVDKSSIDLNTADDADDTRNRIQIAKINLEVPFFEGGAEELEKGAWHRFPDRGNPEKGGNFILSAHRFRMGLTPSQTKFNSPFYSIGVLQVGDAIRVFYNGKWYDYTITKKYSVKPTDVYIEGPSVEPKLTLYSCTLGGSADGRDVIEARLKDAPVSSKPSVKTPSKEQIRSIFGPPLNRQAKPVPTTKQSTPTPKSTIQPTAQPSAIPSPENE